MPALPVIYFVDEKQQILGSICKYGNLHVSTLEKKGDKLFSSGIIFVFSSKNTTHDTQIKIR